MWFIPGGCGEFVRDRPVLWMNGVCRIAGPKEWLDEFWRVDEQETVELLLEKGAEDYVIE